MYKRSIGLSLAFFYKRLACLIFALVPAGLVGQVQAAPFAYAINSGTDYGVSVIDTATNTVVATLPTGQFPAAIVLNPAGTRAYVSNLFRDNTVTVLNTVTNRVLATIAVGSGLFRVVLNPTGTRVYITHPDGNSVLVVDTSSNNVIATVPIANPRGIVVNAAGTRAYVTSEGTTSKIAVIDTATNTVIDNVNVGGAGDIVLNPDGTRAFTSYCVFDRATGISCYLAVINTISNEVIGTVALGNLGSESILSINPAGTRVYVTSGDDQFATTMKVVNAVNKKLITTIDLGFGTVPKDLIFNASGSRAYLALASSNSSQNTGYVAVIDTASNGVITNLTSGPQGRPNGLALNPHATRIYVAYEAFCGATSDPPGGVAIFNTVTNTFRSSIPIGGVCEGTRAIAMGPPTRLRFSSAVYGVNEGAGRAVITVRRIGGAVGTTSVRYNTANGTAVAPRDYAARNGTLTWANGDTAPKTFIVPIVNDTLREANETVRLSLSNPTGGATLGWPKTATLTLINND